VVVRVLQGRGALVAQRTLCASRAGRRKSDGQVGHARAAARHAEQGGERGRQPGRPARRPLCSPGPSFPSSSSSTCSSAMPRRSACRQRGWREQTSWVERGAAKKEPRKHTAPPATSWSAGPAQGLIVALRLAGYAHGSSSWLASSLPSSKMSAAKGSRRSSVWSARKGCKSLGSSGGGASTMPRFGACCCPLVLRIQSRLRRARRPLSALPAAVDARKSAAPHASVRPRHASFPGGLRAGIGAHCREAARHPTAGGAASGGASLHADAQAVRAPALAEAAQICRRCLVAAQGLGVAGRVIPGGRIEQVLVVAAAPAPKKAREGEAAARLPGWRAGRAVGPGRRPVRARWCRGIRAAPAGAGTARPGTSDPCSEMRAL
jgi:hypothetical protein